MVTKLEALNYRCLRHVYCDLGNFHVLVGPNASGKSTFLDVMAFLSDLVESGPEVAAGNRSADPADLLWFRHGDTFELAVEVAMPKRIRQSFTEAGYTTLRYEIAVDVSASKDEINILSETLRLKADSGRKGPSGEQRSLFPAGIRPPDTIVSSRGRPGEKTTVSKAKGQNDNFHPEPRNGSNKDWSSSFQLGP
ncbi:MAG: AAA family ATPase, partial [Planctomycetota bacterium]